MRKTGKADDGGAKVELGGIPPLSSTEFAPGTKSKTTIKSSASGTGTISLDSSELSSGENIAVKTLTIKGAGEGGGGATCKVLATEDMEIGNESEGPEEPGEDPDEPYEDPEDTFDDDEGINADGNEISSDGGSLGGEKDGYCNSMFGGGGAPSQSDNNISLTCSK